VEVWHSGKPVYVLTTVTDGHVTADADRSVRRNLSCTLVDATGALTQGDVTDLLNPYDCEVAAFRGVQVGSTIEYAPHGVFALTGRNVQDSPDGLVITLDGQDRTMGYQGPMVSALAISAGTPIEVAVQMLLATRNPGLTLRSMVTGFTCGPLLFSPAIDVWAEASNLALSVGASLFHDRVGQCVLAASGPASNTAVAAYSEGDGLLLDVSRKEDADTIHNVVVVESTSGLVRAVAEDTDPTSPTYAGGRYGRRPVTITNQHVGSPDQAAQAATSRLIYELGRSDTVTFDAVPNPASDVAEVVTVNRPRIGLSQRAVTVATLDMPLTVGNPMRVGCRRAVRAPDGTIMPVTSL
jgi:hypothetical protein